MNTGNQLPVNAAGDSSVIQDGIKKSHTKGCYMPLTKKQSRTGPALPESNTSILVTIIKDFSGSP